MMKKKLGSKSLPPLCFRDLWVENIMLKYLVTPSKLNKKQINLLALKVTKKFFEEKEVEGRVWKVLWTMDLFVFCIDWITSP